MAKVQKYFEKFHEVIRIDYETSKPLREKRDIILDRIRKYLKDNKLPGFDELLQGSYAMKTGTIPKGSDYDIDVGLRFGFKDNEHTSKEVRAWVFSAVKDHTEAVDDKGPCCRVTYKDGYHVDLVAYARWEDSSSKDQFRLAHKTNGWRPADPPKLLEFVDNARAPFKGTEDATGIDQFRRCIRYLRRWNDVFIPGEVEGKPTGLGFVLLASQYLKQPSKLLDGGPDDRKALEGLVTSAAAQQGRLVAKKPTPEYEDVLSKLTDEQMKAFRDRCANLRDALKKADAEADPVEACKILQTQFGEDFPLPDPGDTGKKSVAPAIVPSSSSA